MAKPVRHGGGWRIRWKGADGRRRSETFARFEDAKLALAKRRVDAEEERLGIRRSSLQPRTFAELCNEWMSTRGARKRSKKTDESFIRSHLLPAFGRLPIRQIDVGRVERFKAERSTLHPNTVNHHLTLLGSMLRHAVEIGWLDVVPKIRKHKVPVLETNFRYLKTAEEVRRFLRAAAEVAPEHEALYATAVFTGMRAGELAGLRWADVDLEAGLITVNRSYEGPPKNGEARHVPILAPLRPVLRRHRLQTSGRLVFPTRAGGMRQKSDRAFQEHLHRVLAAAELPQGYVTFHGLRHTFASHWMMSGGDIFKLQRILGHKTPAMTQRYSHLAPDAFAADLDRMNSLRSDDGASVASMEVQAGGTTVSSEARRTR